MIGPLISRIFTVRLGRLYRPGPLVDRTAQVRLGQLSNGAV